MTVSKTNAPASWRLKAPCDGLTQGVVVSGFSTLPYAQALFLGFGWNARAVAGKGRWLQDLQGVAAITNADGRDPRAAAIAFTWTGLEKLGLSKDALATFSDPFREGMYQEDRLRRLGDKIEDTWQGTVIKDGPRWSGNTPPRNSDTSNPPVGTPTTVHALLLLYGDDVKSIGEWADEIIRQLAPHQVSVVHRLSLDLQLDDKGVAREHFGFADGLSQPIPYGESVVLSDGRPSEADKLHGVPLGEILIGHPNVHHEDAPGPVVANDVLASGTQLTSDGAPVGFLNFGLNGSYLVVRELRQYVAAFWKSADDGAQKIRAQGPKAPDADANWFAARVIGRNIDGHLLCPNGVLRPDQFGLPQNNFKFFDTDRYGLGCPLGSHVRRANPRDSLAKNTASTQTLLDAANSHRILRRGRKYGPLPKDPRVDDKQERGLLFICLNTDIARQFEFVQQTWVLNKNFATLFDETDPLVGPKGTFTIPEQPLRRIVDVETFVQLAGGEYFFLPSMPALDYLAKL